MVITIELLHNIFATNGRKETHRYRTQSPKNVAKAEPESEVSPEPYYVNDFYPDSLLGDRPISRGPPNWTDIWRAWYDVGKDFRHRTPQDQPLPDFQMDWLRQHKDSLVRNVRFITQIGNGAFSTVWVVRCKYRKIKGKKMACKVIRLNDTMVKFSLMEKFNVAYSDMLYLTSFRHPNLVRVFETINIPDRKTRFPFSSVLVFMELCHGDLQNVLDQYPNNIAPLNVCKAWVRQIANALVYLHEDCLLADLDIKPENILFKFPYRMPLTRDNVNAHIDGIVWKLADLGLAVMHQFGEDQVVPSQRGSRDFWPPEMDRFRPPVQSKPCDIYSLGATLLYCLYDRNQYLRHQYSGQLDQLMLTIFNHGPFDYIDQHTARLIFLMVNRFAELRLPLKQLLTSKWLNDEDFDPTYPTRV